MSWNPDPGTVPLAPVPEPAVKVVDRVELDTPPSPTTPPVTPGQVSVTTESSPLPVEVQYEQAQAAAADSLAAETASVGEGAEGAEGSAEPEPAEETPAITPAGDAQEPPPSPLSVSPLEDEAVSTTEGEAPPPEAVD
jgi:hypothetical protein